jgi:hypothetical protein
MINCKIGLISFCIDSSQNCFLNLGEIFDKDIRENKNTLYEIHTNMKYMCPFKVVIEDGNITPDNMEEIAIIQERYKLTRKISMIGKCKSKKFRSPKLYDISCMVPLFPTKAPRLRYSPSNATPIRMIILFPYNDPVLRGEIIDACFSFSVEKQTFFYVIGTVQGCNLASTCELTRRYLLTCGVKNNDITTSYYDIFPDCILEALDMIDFILPCKNIELIIAVSKKDMSKVMRKIRLWNSEGKLKKKVQLICNY